ncbi:MAG: hypothetical protein KAQ71_07800 [Desulfobulbaceae bacterium]|nr:hypothetical protein [Desulfobulbaceae bacterium]
MRRNDHSINRAACYGSKIVCLVFIAILWAAFSHEPAFAHKVTIFAWVDGDTIHTRSKFSGGKRVKGSLVVVFDSEGNSLLEGKTDENGMFSFKIPQKTELKVVLKASMGHMAVWKIPVEEITGSQSESNILATVEEVTATSPSNSESIKIAGEVSELSTMELKKKEIQEIIDTSLDKKLRPITEMLVDSMECGPGLTEIMGGIGYIIGLVGIALYFSNRRRKE